MAITTRYECDRRHVEKRKSNRWWVVSPREPGNLCIRTLEQAILDGLGPSDVKLCGNGCLLGQVSEWAAITGNYRNGREEREGENCQRAPVGTF